jgi:dolichol-phosphate mannosyltransferase
MKITVVIPAKNEEQNIADVIRQCKPYCDEVLVIDGHSKDKTKDVAEAAGARVELDGGRGKGDGIRAGIAAARGDIIVFVDADGSHNPQDIPTLTAPVADGKYDMVIGSRMRGGSDELHGDIGKFIRMVGSDIITLSINYRFGVRITDSQNGFRAVRRTAAQAVRLTENIFTVEQEMLMKVLKKGYRVGEVPAHEYCRRHGKSGIVVWKMAPRYVWCLIKNLF